jgi:hypothetical protein
MNTQLLRDLTVDASRHPRGQAHLSAASGLVLVDRRAFIVADDEHHLGSFVLDGDGPVELHRLAPGELPRDPKARKKEKADFECLALLPGFLLALGSGSKPNRERGFRVPLDADGRPGAAEPVDLAPWYARLKGEFDKPNIEGAFACGERFILLQRGNKGDRRNACIDFRLAEVLAWLDGARARPPGLARILPFALGEEDGVPLGFTDGTAMPDGGWAFSAVAEDTHDSYEDGACAASAIGRVDAHGQLVRMRPLKGSPKVEGIAVDAARGRLLMVTDADDPAVPSRLLTVSLDEA